MELPMIVIAIVSMAIGLGGVCFWLGRYVERLAWNKLIWQGKLPKPKKTPKRFGNPIVEGKYYEVAEA